MIWVIDASVAIRWFVEEETHPLADLILEKLIDEPVLFAVPELFCFEVYSVLLRVHPLGLKVFREGVIPLLLAGLFRQPMTEKLSRLAYRYVQRGLTGYDACYAALARDLKGVWLTFDQKAHQSIQREHVSWFLGKGLPAGWPE
jgi:predicted nucleic acid-binding protein